MQSAAAGADQLGDVEAGVHRPDDLCGIVCSRSVIRPFVALADCLNSYLPSFVIYGGKDAVVADPEAVGLVPGEFFYACRAGVLSKVVNHRHNTEISVVVQPVQLLADKAAAKADPV